MTSTSTPGFAGQPGTRRVEVGGRPVWQKCHGSRSRRLRLRLLDTTVRLLGVTPLRPPPHPGGAEGAALEARRIAELQALGARVPEVLGQDGPCLLLSDLGPTLAGRIRAAQPPEALALFARAAAAIAAVHARGGYLGQPQARNIAVDAAGQVGFFDFEEDPVAVMGLADAQARDWLIFAAGTCRHLPQPAPELGAVLRAELAPLPVPPMQALDRASRRLGFLAPLARFEGRRAAGLGKAVLALREACSA